MFGASNLWQGISGSSVADVFMMKFLSLLQDMSRKWLLALIKDELLRHYPLGV